MMREFNIVVAGIGGQGTLTLGNIIAAAALKQGYDVKTSELHGLAQRGGSVPCHIRFGEKIFSPLVVQGGADLVIGLEPLEALRAAFYGSKERGTVFLFDSRAIPPTSIFIKKEKYPSTEEIREMLGYFSKEIVVVEASDTVKKETGDTAMANIYMLGYAYGKNLIPLEREYLLENIKRNVPEKHLEINRKVFELGFLTGKKN